jgi:F-type H+-transporting ATPase subunit b
MKFDIWTFLFQIINFVVLLFILKRLLYKPIREIMDKRRGIIEKNVEDAEKTKMEAQELKRKYQEEMDKLKDVRILTFEKLQEEVEVERKKLMGRAEEEAGKIIEKERAIFDTEKKRLETELKDKAIDTVCVFASRLLRDISDEELHSAIYRKLLKEVERITSDITKIEKKDEPLTIEIITAYELSEEKLKGLQKTIESLISRKVNINQTIDKNLIAGIKIKVYDMVYDSSLSGQIDSLKLRLKGTA